MSSVAQTEKVIFQQEWGQVLAQSLRSSQQLLAELDLQVTDFPEGLSEALQFPLFVPRPFVELMRKGDPRDPLLVQVLPLAAEEQVHSGFTLDPLAEQSSNVQTGLIHKYHGRVLLLAASGCAINCRYCFRRHFPYSENRVARGQWQPALSYIAQDSSTVKKWGKLQYYKTVDENMTPAQIKDYAQNLLKSLGQVNRGLKIPAMGIKEIRAGSMVYIDLQDLGDIALKKMLLIDKCTHKITEHHHEMDLEMKVYND